jgi:hypothetical protein
MKQSLLGHLVFSISNKTENLATEALCFILNRSLIANKAFIQSISQKTGLELPPNLKFNTQKFSDLDESIPDLVGLDIDGKEVILGEAKFWAGLTGNQPVTYLERLSKTSGSILIFIAPSKRFATLWPELLRRCKELGTQQPIIEEDEFKAIAIDKYPMLALVSWRRVINSIQRAVGDDGDSETLSDIGQLQGLCDQMDETAFLPIQSEELTSDIGKRILQYCGLVDEITEILVKSGLASLRTPEGSKVLRASWGGVTLRSMVIHQYGCQLQFNSTLWDKYGGTPIWFGIKKIGTGKYWTFASEAKTKLIRLGLEVPSRLIHDGDTLFVPLFIPTGVEKSDIVKSLLKQIQEVIDILATINE